MKISCLFFKISEVTDIVFQVAFKLLNKFASVWGFDFHLSFAILFLPDINLCRHVSTLPARMPPSFTSSPFCPPPRHCQSVAFLIPAYPLTLSTPSHHPSVSLPNTVFLKPISWFAFSPSYPPHWPSSPCLLVFNFGSDCVGELTSTCSHFHHLHRTPSSSP